MKVTITVTQTDIDAATQARLGLGYTAPKCCPIAQAINRRHHNWVVTETRVLDCDYNGIAVLPGPAMSFIRRFDSGQAVEPFEFEIEV